MKPTLASAVRLPPGWELRQVATWACGAGRYYARGPAPGAIVWAPWGELTIEAARSLERRAAIVNERSSA